MITELETAERGGDIRDFLTQGHSFVSPRLGTCSTTYRTIVCLPDATRWMSMNMNPTRSIRCQSSLSLRQRGELFQTLCPVLGLHDRLHDSRFYITASTSNTHRVLKIDRTDPTALNVVEDATTYDSTELDLLLRMVQDGNKSQGGLEKVLEFQCHL